MSTLSLTSALDRVGGQRHASAALSPGMTRYPLYRRLGRTQDRSGRLLKISPPKLSLDLIRRVIYLQDLITKLISNGIISHKLGVMCRMQKAFSNFTKRIKLSISLIHSSHFKI
jgi:hypothetical protein